MKKWKRSCFPRGLLLILVCLSLAACGRADKAYEKAFADNSIEAYQAALKEYPDHERAGEARTRLEAMLFDACATAREQAACESYLTTLPGESRAAEIATIRDGIAIETALADANLPDEYAAYEKLIQSFPNQKTLVQFDGSFGPFMEAYIPLEELCKDDLPELERLASQQGMSLDQVESFSGLRVNLSRGDDQGSTEEIRTALCPVPMWSVERLSLFDPPEERPDGSVIRRYDFGELSRKNFSFIARQGEGGYRIIATRLIAPAPKPNE